MLSQNEYHLTYKTSCTINYKYLKMLLNLMLFDEIILNL